MKPKVLFSWLLRIIAAVIMLQTLYFKFTAQPESIYIFTTVGMEPWGRILTGVGELVASVLLLWPRTVVFGAILSILLMAGAIMTHVLILGIDVMGDHGQLFAYACFVFAASLILLFIHKERVFQLIGKTKSI
jgi:hypothetical protein